jgi:hypothetical protein
MQDISIIHLPKTKSKEFLGLWFCHNIWQDVNITAVAARRRYGCPTLMMAESAG